MKSPGWRPGIAERLSRLVRGNDRINEAKEIIKQEKIKLNRIKENILSGSKRKKSARRLSRTGQEIMPLKQALLQMKAAAAILR